MPATVTFHTLVETNTASAGTYKGPPYVGTVTLDVGDYVACFWDGDGRGGTWRMEIDGDMPVPLAMSPDTTKRGYIHAFSITEAGTKRFTIDSTSNIFWKYQIVGFFKVTGLSPTITDDASIFGGYSGTTRSTTDPLVVPSGGLGFCIGSIAYYNGGRWASPLVEQGRYDNISFTTAPENYNAPVTVEGHVWAPVDIWANAFQPGAGMPSFLETPNTWNPARSKNNVIIDGLTIRAPTTNISASGFCVGTCGRSGRRYFEFYCGGLTAGKMVVGVATAETLTDWGFPGNGTIPGASYRKDGFGHAQGVTLDLRSTLGTWGTGDTIGVLVDTVLNKIWWSKNGVWWGNPEANTGGASITYQKLFASANIFISSTTTPATDWGTLNTGGSPFTHTVPTGATAWDAEAYSGVVPAPTSKPPRHSHFL